MSHFANTGVLVVEKVGFDIEHGNLFKYLEGTIDKTAERHHVIITNDERVFAIIDKEQLLLDF